jgi:branched-chain amino acid transport system ATP-binding protein
VSDLSKSFGASRALDGVSFDVLKGEILGIAGPNGSGKSTLFNAITRIPFAQLGGSVTFNGMPISHLAGNEIARQGVVRTFQRQSVFANLSAVDNVLVTLEQTKRAKGFDQRLALAEPVVS